VDRRDLTLAAAKTQVGLLPEPMTGHLVAGYDSDVTRKLLPQGGFEDEISRRGFRLRFRSTSAGSSNGPARG
jgi:hypothetical protein